MTNLEPLNLKASIEGYDKKMNKLVKRLERKTILDKFESFKFKMSIKRFNKKASKETKRCAKIISKLGPITIK